MKRKILSLALIAALVFALAVSAFAAGSPSEDDVLPAVDNGGTVTAVSEAVKIEAVSRADSTSGWGRIATSLGTTYDNIKLVTVQTVFDYEGPSAAGQQVTFTDVPGVKKGQVVVAYHKWQDTGLASDWEVLKAVATADGTVVVTFNGSASPLAIVTVTLKSDLPTTPSTSTTTSTTVVTSPQTSDIG